MLVVVLLECIVFCIKICLNVKRILVIEFMSAHLNVSDVISLSSSGSILRAWNLPDGQMVWESSLQGSKESNSILNIPVSDFFSFLFLIP